ncbi:MAG TPA: ABC transporter permease subunit [Candidatus Limnocylindrales bacterium]|nr:ABC transporter permease subunit [Candidatus Limnocylindrales bacterium]
MISGPLLRQTWRAHRLRVLLIALALGVWGFLMPVIYATFGMQMEVLLESGIVPDAFLRLLGADPFSLGGAVALGTVHPVALGLQLIYPVGFAAAAIAGERQRGTLEVLLSRPVSRPAVLVTLLVAIATFAAISTAAQLLGTVLGAMLYDVAGQLDAAALAFLWLNTFALLMALAAVSLAASASFDRLSTPIGVGLGLVIAGYVLEVLGTIWPDAAFLQPASPFHYLQPLDILAGRTANRDVLVLAGLFVAGAAFGLWRFPRRDLAAPT